MFHNFSSVNYFQQSKSVPSSGIEAKGHDSGMSLFAAIIRVLIPFDPALPHFFPLKLLFDIIH